MVVADESLMTPWWQWQRQTQRQRQRQNDKKTLHVPYFWKWYDLGTHHWKLWHTVSWWNQVSPEALAKFWMPAGSKKLLCWGTCRKLRCTAFRICLSCGWLLWSKWVKKRIFSKKVPKKQRFWGTQIGITWLWSSGSRMRGLVMSHFLKQNLLRTSHVFGRIW